MKSEKIRSQKKEGQGQGSIEQTPTTAAIPNINLLSAEELSRYKVEDLADETRQLTDFSRVDDMATKEDLVAEAAKIKEEIERMDEQTMSVDMLHAKLLVTLKDARGELENLRGQSRFKFISKTKKDWRKSKEEELVAEIAVNETDLKALALKHKRPLLDIENRPLRFDMELEEITTEIGALEVLRDELKKDTRLVEDAPRFVKKGFEKFVNFLSNFFGQPYDKVMSLHQIELDLIRKRIRGLVAKLNAGHLNSEERTDEISSLDEGEMRYKIRVFDSNIKSLPKRVEQEIEEEAKDIYYKEQFAEFIKEQEEAIKHTAGNIARFMYIPIFADPTDPSYNDRLFLQMATTNMEGLKHEIKYKMSESMRGAFIWKNENFIDESNRRAFNRFLRSQTVINMVNRIIDEVIQSRVMYLTKGK
ncbi:MAG: hypothetical protein HY225_02100 [Candidatus Vogelbacteria bacterium]|nr:hypothetical protein [Candidatus Vogelbacteria bacterium]